MTALWIVAIVLACLFLLSLVRIGGRVEYDETGLLVRLRLGAFSLTVYPMKPKKKKVEKAPEPAQEPKEPPTRGGSFALVRDMLPLVAEAAGRLRKKIRIDDLTLDLLWSHPDPAVCGMGFGAANGAVGMIWPLIEQNFHVKRYRIRTGVDFHRGSPEIRVTAAVSLTIGQAMAMGLRLFSQFLKIYRRHRPAADQTTKKEAV